MILHRLGGGREEDGWMVTQVIQLQLYK